MSGGDVAPHQLLDDGFPPDPADVLVVGCGNILRGDDAAGPILVRRLAERGVPDGVRLVDGGTAGMDVAFSMRGARRVVLVDAANTDNAPGTLYRLPSSALDNVPPLSGLHLHNFRWDHALAFADWLLGDHKPTDITVFLIEADTFEPGAPLTDPVAATVEELADLLQDEFWPSPGPDLNQDQAADPGQPEDTDRVQINDQGYLHLPAALAAAYFPGDVALAHLGIRDGAEVVELMPLHSAVHGGLVLKQRNAAGDRSLLVSEVLGFSDRTGDFGCAWDPERGTLVISLDTSGAPDEQRTRSDHADQSGEPAMGGVVDRHDTRGSGTPAPDRPSDTSPGPTQRRDGTPQREPQATSSGAPR